MSENVSPEPPTGSTETSRGIRWAVLIPPIVVGLALLAVVSMLIRPDPPPVTIDRPTPELDLVRLIPAGDRVRSGDLPTGQVTLVHFWGTWCAPCRQEYPVLATMLETFRDDPQFTFLSVSCEGGSETMESLRDQTAEFLAKYDLEHDVYCDPAGSTRRSWMESFERTNLFYPTSVLIGADGKIADVWEGYRPESVAGIARAITKALERSPAES